MTAPKVSIVVLAYLESNKPYLDACLASINNLDYPKDRLDVTCMSPWMTAHDYPDTWIGQNTKRANSFSGSVNRGVEVCDPGSEFILIMSDDTIIARESLSNMVQTIGEQNMILAATSNCDLHWKYNLMLPHIYPTRFYKIGDVNPVALMNSKSVYPRGIMYTDRLCFYSVLIPRKVWNQVGELDEGYNMGFEDTDYCMRASKLGVQMGIALDSIIWHAGGATSEVITQDMRDSNEKRFNDKWTKG